MEIRIRNVDEWIVEFHRKQAKNNNISLEKQIRNMLAESALANRRARAKQMRKDLEQMREKYGTLPDSTAYIRAERNRRG